MTNCPTKEETPINPPRNDIQVGGRLFKFRKNWVNSNVTSIISQGLSWQWKNQPPPFKRLHQNSCQEIKDFILEMTSKKVVEKAKLPIKWQSRLFTVPKKDSDKRRIILDLSLLNLNIKCPSFKMLTLREVKLLIPSGHFTTSIDLKDGYWHIPIAPSKRPFLGFE